MYLQLNVNEATRRLKFADLSAVAAVIGDKSINGIVFILPASYEGDFDFSTGVWRVNFTDTSNVEHTVLLDQTDTETGMPLWVFDDTINKGKNGTVKFSFEVEEVDASTSAVTKDWNSLPATFQVYKTCSGDNEDEEAEEETIYDRLASAIQALREAQAGIDDIATILAGLTSSSPTVVATVADLANVDTSEYQLAIVEADGYLYYYDGADWQPGFEYGGLQEVIDARTDGNTGTVYTSLKARLDGVEGEINEDLNTKISRVNGYAPDANGNVVVPTSGFTNRQMQAILACFRGVMWDPDTDGGEYTELYNSFYNVAVASISAAFSPGEVTFTELNTLDDLKQYLTVTAYYDNGTVGTIVSYTLSGTLAEGTSTITVTFGGQTTTFNVTVSAISFNYGVYTPTELVNGKHIDANGDVQDGIADQSHYIADYIPVVRSSYWIGHQPPVINSSPMTSMSNWRVSEYDAQKNFIKQTQFADTTENGAYSSKLVTFDVNTAFIRLGWYDSSGTSHVFDIEDPDTITALPMESGDINATTGVNATEVRRIRFSDYLAVSSDTITIVGCPFAATWASWSPVYACGVRCYDTNQAYLGSVTVLSPDSGTSLELLAGTAYVRMIMQYNDAASLVNFAEMVAYLMTINGTKYYVTGV